MNKKSQNASQMFVYIIAIIIVGVILFFGYNAISDFIGRTDQITLVDFQNKMQSSIKSITNQYGSFKRKEFVLSGEYLEVCFVRNYETSEVELEFVPANFADHPIILDNIDFTDPISPIPLKNVFLIKQKGTEPLDEIGKIKFAGNSMLKCFDVVDGRLTINIEGKGDHVVIS